jgi:hypothetical protein
MLRTRGHSGGIPAIARVLALTHLSTTNTRAQWNGLQRPVFARTWSLRGFGVTVSCVAAKLVGQIWLCSGRKRAVDTFTLQRTLRVLLHRAGVVRWSLLRFADQRCLIATLS